ncbi:lipopolysaccharide 1,2-N-acetylglucosaminetransferase, partial [Escherichia coli]|nr:lipopolysaccharide 1,2-N-acetylglucosaminetransferase [Escherichia coli]
DKIKEFIGDTRIVIINPLGAKKICRLTFEQIKVIYQEMKLHFENYRVIFTGLPQDLLTIPIPEIETLPFNEFIYTVALTKYSDFVISVDTALVHI